MFMCDDLVSLSRKIVRSFKRQKAHSKKQSNKKTIDIPASIAVMVLFLGSFAYGIFSTSASQNSIISIEAQKQSYSLEWLRKDASLSSFEEKEVEATENTLSADDVERETLRLELEALLAEYPMEEMIPALVEQDKMVAAFLVGIAKKESNWGKRVPTLNGDDCFNYWGYKGGGSKGFALGYGCFATPQEAVDVVGGRIQELIANGKRTTPQSMIVWKCGSSCASHSPESVRKWVSDVNIYYSRVLAYGKIQ